MLKIGDKVVYITGKNMPKDSIHEVSDVEYKDCGCHSIAINGKKIIRTSHSNDVAICSMCGKFNRRNYYINGNNWAMSSFRKVDESFADSVLEKITEQIKEEELELV